MRNGHPLIPVLNSLALSVPCLAQSWLAHQRRTFLCASRLIQTSNGIIEFSIGFTSCPMIFGSIPLQWFTMPPVLPKPNVSKLGCSSKGRKTDVDVGNKSCCFFCKSAQRKATSSYSSPFDLEPTADLSRLPSVYKSSTVPK